MDIKTENIKKNLKEEMEISSERVQKSLKSEISSNTEILLLAISKLNNQIENRTQEKH